MPPRTQKDGNKLYCGPVCRAAPLAVAADVVGGEPCAHCSRLFVKASPRQKYCGVSCRVGAFKVKEASAVPDGDDSEIEIRELEESPRRIRVARLFAIYSGGDLDGFAPAFTPTRFLSERRHAR